MNIKSELLRLFQASAIEEVITLQDLWSGYGSIDCYIFKKSPSSAQLVSSVIVKSIKAPHYNQHPRGWGGEQSHQRKLRSYQVEQHWYREWSRYCNRNCKVAKFYGFFEDSGNELNGDLTSYIILEDLNELGFDQRAETLTTEQTKPCLKWLAHFHACFMADSHQQATTAVSNGLWPIGTYWHLETRLDEFNAMVECDLKNHAQAIHQNLQQCRYKTLVHGDAKVANFCFNHDKTDVAAVDFQYIGDGCGMKDIVYFLGSCLSENDCKIHYSTLLDYYFLELKNALQAKSQYIDIEAIESEWRQLFIFCWADFNRFILGWAPQHTKNNDFSQVMTELVIKKLRGSPLLLS